MRWHSILGMAFLAGVVVLGTAETSEAQRRGGGGRGGSRGGYSGYSGYRGGYSGYRGGYYGGWGGYYGRGWGYGYYPGYYSSYPYYYSDSYYAEPAVNTYRSYYPSTDVITEESNPEQAMTAHVTVRVPPDAQLWFNGVRMRSTGPNREFDTPPLTGGNRFTYEAKASWMENGREVTQTQDVAVVPGRRVTIAFPTRTSR